MVTISEIMAEVRICFPDNLVCFLNIKLHIYIIFKIFIKSFRQINRYRSAFLNTSTAVYCSYNPGSEPADIKDKINS